MSMGDLENALLANIEEVAMFIQESEKERAKIAERDATICSSIREASTDLSRLKRSLTALRGEDESKDFPTMAEANMGTRPTPADTSMKQAGQKVQAAFTPQSYAEKKGFLR